MKDTFPVIPLDLPQRRSFLLKTFQTAGAVTLTGFLAACGGDDDDDDDSNGSDNPGTDDPGTPGGPAKFNAFKEFGPLQAPDANGVMLPKGFKSRIVATSGQLVDGTAYTWHGAPDGGACFPTPDGGWVYVSNSETGAAQTGGAGALKFDKNGNIVGAYAILKGTDNNCAGGPTPWNTWLSCEEHGTGQVWECDPFNPWENATKTPPKPALGFYAHEAVAVDPANRTLYLTEDAGGGRIYRFVCDDADWPEGAERPKMETGTLQTLRIKSLAANEDSYSNAGRQILSVGLSPVPVEWEDVEQPDQPQSTVRGAINGGGGAAPGNYFEKAEGIWFYNGIIFFVTSFNHRIWAYDTKHETLEVIFEGNDDNADLTHSINEPDNITVTGMGSILVAEDSGNLEISVLYPETHTSQAVMRLFGHDSSEITGPAVTPDGKRLYFSSQRGTDGTNGITFEITLPTKAADLGL